MNKNNKTKELIYDTALDILRSEHNLTLKAIADKASVNIAAINYYFGDKESLIVEMINRELHQAKQQVSLLLDNFENSNKYEDTFISIVSYLYDFFIKNFGVLDYIIHSNNNLADKTIFSYVHEISLDSAFMDKIMKYVYVLSPFYDMDDCKVKYIQLISTFAFPLLCELNFIKRDVIYFNSIRDEKFRKEYIKQICKTFFDN